MDRTRPLKSVHIRVPHDIWEKSVKPYTKNNKFSQQFLDYISYWDAHHDKYGNEIIRAAEAKKTTDPKVLDYGDETIEEFSSFFGKTHTKVGHAKKLLAQYENYPETEQGLRDYLSGMRAMIDRKKTRQNEKKQDIEIQTTAREIRTRIRDDPKQPLSKYDFIDWFGFSDDQAELYVLEFVKRGYFIPYKDIDGVVEAGRYTYSSPQTGSYGAKNSMGDDVR